MVQASIYFILMIILKAPVAMSIYIKSSYNLANVCFRGCMARVVNDHNIVGSVFRRLWMDMAMHGAHFTCQLYINQMHDID